MPAVTRLECLLQVWARAIRACQGGHAETGSAHKRRGGRAQGGGGGGGGGQAHGAGDAECVLWFVADGPESNANLLRQAGERGLAADRIVLAQRAEFDRHAVARLELLPWHAYSPCDVPVLALSWPNAPSLTGTS